MFKTISPDTKVSQTAVLQRLQQIIEPDLGVDIVGAGLVYDITICEHNIVRIKMTWRKQNDSNQSPTIELVRQKIEQIPGIGGVDINLVFSPAWTMHRMTEQAKKQCGLIFLGGTHESR